MVCGLVIGLLAFSGAAMAAWSTHLPQPWVHDEFSYLLAADTFVHGRLTNPTHPMWQHFESMHIVQQPTYASKYPPGQGLVLALGRLIGGHPVVGVWISAGLGCAAIYWMLLAWVPPSWALLGGLLVVARIGIPSYWSQSYWGGWVAACGGALVFGGVRRLVRHARVRDALAMAIGLVVLANSRPYEGLAASVPAIVIVSVWLFRARGLRLMGLRRTVAVASAVCLLGAGWMAFYNWRVTGNPLQMPYLLHESTYAMAPTFIWQRTRSVLPYRHAPIRNYQFSELDVYNREQTFSGFALETRRKATELFFFFLGSVLGLPLIALPWLWRDRWMQFALGTCILFAAALLMETHMFPHYAAPLTCIVYLLLIQSLRRLRLVAWRAVPVGLLLVWLFPLACAYHLWTSFALPIRGFEPDWALGRAAILDRLEHDGDRHLIVVRYDDDHDPNHEWVYNAADIDGSRVVWAREMDPDSNRRLLTYFAGRRVWLLEADADAPSLTPYQAF